MAFLRTARKVKPNCDAATTLSDLPNEMLLAIFKNLDIVTLLSLCNVSQRFHQLAHECLIKRLKESSTRLHLHFIQEHKWRHEIEMVLSDVDRETGNLIFQQNPEDPSSMRMYHSAIIRNPNLSRVHLTYTHNGKQEKVAYPLSVPILRHAVREDENLLQKTYTMPIKYHGTIRKAHTVYRKGEGSTHLPVHYNFVYEVNDTPTDVQRIRKGERYVKPIEFSCPVSFFYPHEPTAHKIFMSLMTNYKKRNSRRATLKKKHPKAPEANRKQGVVSALASSQRETSAGLL